MGEVYRAKDTRLGREVAIKVLPDHLNGDASALARFEREAKVLAALSHPNILSIFDVGSGDGTSFVVMELLPGETLRDRILQRRPHWPQAVQMGIEIAEGLSAAHSGGIIHRDLKPENIFLSREEHVKILDFGLARWDPDCTTEGTEFAITAGPATETGILMGTIPYMSPEQLRGLHVDARSDIFSFGCVLQEMITGQHPFARSSGAETISAILKEDAPSLLDFDATVPAELDQVVKRCLNKEPDLRFQSALDLAFHLRQILSGASLPGVAGRDARPTGRNVKAITAAIILLLVGTFVFYWIDTKKAGVDRPQFKSVAVLPLLNLSSDPEQEYFADGMTEAVISDLAKIKAMNVISRTSVMGYKDSKKSLREIAGELQADALIEGSVMRSGDHVRITVQLIDASTDQHLWAESYERDLKDVVSLQGEVARTIAQQVRAIITPEEQQKLAQKRPVDPELYELYLKARHLMHRGDLEKAMEYFESFIAKDPNNALAYSGLADAHFYNADVHESPPEATAKSRAAVMKALELDESLAEAHTSLAGIMFTYDWDWSGAEREYKRAIELNPGYADAHDWYGYYLAVTGRLAEGLAHFETARKLDPLQPWVYADKGYSYFMSRKYNEAIEQYHKSLEIAPDDPEVIFSLGLAYAQKGDYSAAISTMESAAKREEHPLSLAGLANAYALAGRRDDSKRILRQLEKLSQHRYVCPYEVAAVHAQLKEKDEAFRFLSKSFQDRSGCLVQLRRDPRLDFLRSDSRYQEMLAKMNFPL